jgi:SpoVK/Ycf46/Vps4 family AAA+-type ATPase
MSANTSHLKSFHYLENGEINFSVFDTIKTTSKLDVGTYKVAWVSLPTGGNKLEVKIDTDIETVKMSNFKDKKKLDELFKSFFNKKVAKRINELGFYHKVGVLLYGKQGTGKSTIIKNYCQYAIAKHNAIVLYVNMTRGTVAQWDFVRKIRAIQKNPIIVVIEEMDGALAEGNSTESAFKSYFDGNESIDNCIIFGTTNYIDKIPTALKDRPSRFKYCLEINGIEDESDVYDIMMNMIGDIFEPTEVVDYARELVNSTLDEIKQFCIDKIMDIDSYKVTKKIGFTV